MAVNFAVSVENLISGGEDKFLCPNHDSVNVVQDAPWSDGVTYFERLLAGNGYKKLEVVRNDTHWPWPMSSNGLRQTDDMF